MAIPQNFIQELVSRADIVDIVGRSVQLKKGGANYMGLCPFHGEKSPSFSVSPSKQFYHCFGCGKNGNVISFLIDNNGMTFIEAVQDLAQQFGMSMPEDDASPQDRERAAQQRARQSTLTDVLEKAGEAYRKQLKISPRAVAYFKGRGVSGEIAKEFGLGYAPEGWRSLASVFPDYDEPLLAESGLVIVGEESAGTATSGSEPAASKRYDRFRDRVMFPIRNVKGECIGFGGRVLGDRDGTTPQGAGPKYLNSPETPVFSKGRELYGLYEARQALREHGFVLVTEGYMDVVALAQLGFPNAVATLGTACTPEHVQKLFRFTDSVVFSFDGDAAGRRAARKALDGALPYATDVRSVKFLFLPPEHDPDSFIREFGREAFSRYVSEATPLSRFLIEAAREGCDLGTAEGRAHMAANAKPLWTALPDGALKSQLLVEIAKLAQLETAELAGVWGHKAPAAAWRKRQAEGAPRPSRLARSLPPGRADRALQIVLAEPSAWETLSHDDHQLLCELASPHGPLFSWLDSQVHDHGPQPWATLRDALQAHEYGAFATGQVDKVLPDIENDLQELRQILALEGKRRADGEMTQLVARAPSDPAAYERLKQLIEAQKNRTKG